MSWRFAARLAPRGAAFFSTCYVEAGILSTAAALVGLGVAVGLLQLITFYGANYIPRIDEIRLFGPALLWLAGLTLASAVMIGLVPALHGSRIRADAALRAGGRSATDGPASRRVRRVLVAAEFALATPLLVAAALVLLSLDRLNQVPVGLDTGRMLTAAVSLTGARYARDTDRAAFWKRAQERLQAVPGVEAAAVADGRPPREPGQHNNFDLEDRPTLPGQSQPVCPWVGASPEFFKTVGLPLERGRLLDDRSLQEDVVVVDRAWADRFFPGQEVLGRRFRSGGCTSCNWTTVVGVVGNVKWAGLEAPEDGTVYYPLVDLPDAYFVLRTTGDPVSLSLSLQQAVKELDPGLALSNISTGSELVSDALATPRYLSVLIATVALVALGLSIVGIYGVMAYFVQQHTRDIGIRLALGGEPSRVRRMILLQGLRLGARRRRGRHRRRAAGEPADGDHPVRRQPDRLPHDGRRAGRPHDGGHGGLPHSGAARRRRRSRGDSQGELRDLSTARRWQPQPADCGS